VRASVGRAKDNQSQGVKRHLLILLKNFYGWFVRPLLWPDYAWSWRASAVAKGKELRDKRRDVADRDAKRQIDRELKSRR